MGEAIIFPLGLLAAALGAVAIWSAPYNGSFLYRHLTQGLVLAVVAVATGAICLRLMFAQK